MIVSTVPIFVQYVTNDFQVIYGKYATIVICKN